MHGGFDDAARNLLPGGGRSPLEYPLGYRHMVRAIQNLAVAVPAQ